MKKIVFDENEFKRVKVDYKEELKNKKNWFSLHFADIIIKIEGP